jgi:hypothetical protein
MAILRVPKSCPPHLHHEAMWKGSILGVKQTKVLYFFWVVNQSKRSIMTKGKKKMF